MFRGLGFADVLKLDGGGSYYQSRGGAVSKTAENRRINSVLRWTVRDEAPELTEEQAWFDRMMENWMARRNDQPASDWAKPYIQAVIDAGAMTDVGGTIERPQGFITRQEMAVVAAALSKK